MASRIIERFHDAPGTPDVAGGLHHGPVVRRGGDVFGATVNMGSRLADLAPPAELNGTIDAAHAAAEAGAKVEPLGQTMLRGVLDPIEAFAISPCDHHDDGTRTDPVCGMRITPGSSTPSRTQAGRRFWFCAVHCVDRFTADPLRYVEG